MNNITPRSIPDLVLAAQDAANGAAEIGQAVGLKQNDAAAISGNLVALLNSRDSYEAGKVVLSNRRAVVRSLASTARETLRVARDLLKGPLGTEYSTQWDITGFVGSLALPDAAEQVQVRLQPMQTFLTNNPQHENTAASITAVRMESLFNDLSAARTAVFLQQMTVKDLIGARDGAANNLRKRISGLREELTQLLDPLDGRWLAFGFNMPGAEETPDVPEGVEVSLNGHNAAINWSIPARAQYFHVWKRVVGVDQEFLLVGTPQDPNFTLEELPANATIELAVSAVNNGGESARSAASTVTTH